MINNQDHINNMFKLILRRLLLFEQFKWFNVIKEKEKRNRCTK